MYILYIYYILYIFVTFFCRRCGRVPESMGFLVIRWKSRELWGTVLYCAEFCARWECKAGSTEGEGEGYVKR